MPLLLQIVIDLVGLGVPKALLDRYCAERFSNLTRWIISALTLIAVVVASQRYVDYVNRPRHLTDGQRAQLTLAFTKKKSLFDQLVVGANAGDGEGNGYAKDFVDAFNVIGIKTDGPRVVLAQSGVTFNIGIAVRDVRHPPPIAESFAESLSEADFKFIGINMMTLAPDDFMLVIGPRNR